MDAGLHLKLSLLRGETASPMDMADFGRLSAIELRTQTKPALSDRLAVAVMGMIASGNLAPGARLPPERRIAEAVPASRVCVRSALERLKADGYIEAVQGSGTRVVAIEAGTRLGALIRANEENLADLRGFVAFLDRCIVQRLVHRSPPATLEQAARDTGSQPIGDHPQDLAEQETGLRVALASATGNPVYRLVANQLSRGMHSLFGHAFRLAGPDAGAEATQRRQELAAGLLAGDVEAASAALSRAIAVPAEVCRAGTNGSGGDASILRALAVAGPEQLKDRLAREIAGMIATGRACDGDRLISERRLAQLFEVSRASVREALATLKAEGIIASDQRFGTRIVDARSELAAFAAADLDHLKTMARLRGYLEVWAAGRAAERGSEADLEDLRRILTELRRPNLTPRRRIDLDMRLHLTIARAAGSAVQLYITEVLRDLMMAYFDTSLTVFMAGPGRDAMLLDHHTRIVAAILARDVAEAEQAMSEHCGAFSNRYEALG